MTRKIRKFVSDIKRTEYMEYIIYSDESVSKGEYFSDFFGGALVTNTNFNEVNSALEAKKQELNLTGETNGPRRL